MTGLPDRPAARRSRVRRTAGRRTGGARSGRPVPGFARPPVTSGAIRFLVGRALRTFSTRGVIRRLARAVRTFSTPRRDPASVRRSGPQAPGPARPPRGPTAPPGWRSPGPGPRASGRRAAGASRPSAASTRGDGRTAGVLKPSLISRNTASSRPVRPRCVPASSAVATRPRSAQVCRSRVTSDRWTYRATSRLLSSKSRRSRATTKKQPGPRRR